MNAKCLGWADCVLFHLGYLCERCEEHKKAHPKCFETKDIK